jgi:hypothetical protein
MSTPRSGRKDIKSDDEGPNGVQKKREFTTYKMGAHDVKKKIFVAISQVKKKCHVA